MSLGVAKPSQTGTRCPPKHIVQIDSFPCCCPLLPIPQMLHHLLTISAFILHPYLSTFTLELVWILFDTWHLP